MPRFLTAAIVAGALLLPASAAAHGGRSRHPQASTTTRTHASTRHVALGELASHNPVTRAAAVAERYWGAIPCGGQIAVHANMTLPAGLDPTTDGWVTFNSSLGPNNLEAPASTYTRCAISLAHWQWPNLAEMEVDWNMFCLTVIHEMGHLLGHHHSLVPGSVMAPVFTSEANVPPICGATRPAGGELAHRHSA
jgi:hypothetical protein